MSALGYTCFGDGTGHTMARAYNQELNRTYLTNSEADAQGYSFQVALVGDWRKSFYERNVIFAQTEVALVGVAPDVDPAYQLG